MKHVIQLEQNVIKSWCFVSICYKFEVAITSVCECQSSLKKWMKSYQ